MKGDKSLLAIALVANFHVDVAFIYFYKPKPTTNIYRKTGKKGLNYQENAKFDKALSTHTK